MPALYRTVTFVACLTTAATLLGAADARVTVADLVGRLTRDAAWAHVQSVPVGVRTFHPQGMVKIGESIFVSSVEVTRPRTGPTDGGAGIGHLLQLDLSGRLVRRIRLGEGAMYHPGGMDFDGTHIWVSVAEYLPDSRSIVYRIDPATLTVTEVLRFDDHLGAVVVDTDDRSLHGISWGSRRFYRWPLDDAGRPRRVDAPDRRENASHYIDYQDCKYAGRHRMLCTGLASVGPAGGRTVELGGVEVVDLADGRPVHQVPIALWTKSGVAMTRNPAWFEPNGPGLRAYFMPEDDESFIHVFDVTEVANARLRQR